MPLPARTAHDHIFYPKRFHNVPGLGIIHAVITAAADVGANGYTVTHGSKEIASVTRTDEGDVRVILSQPEYKIVNANVILSIADYQPIIAAIAAGVSTTYIDITFQKHSDSAGAPVDPDGATIYLTLFVQSSKLGY